MLAVGGEMRNVATRVREAVIHDAGHWLIEENPAATIAVIEDFLGGK